MKNHKCKECGKSRPLSDFNGGIHSRCRICDRDRKRKWRAANQAMYALMTSCHGQARRAVERGEIRRPKACERCGQNHRRLLMHHERYTRPTDVTWLDDKCHARRHMESKARRRMPIAATN